MTRNHIGQVPRAWSTAAILFATLGAIASPSSLAWSQSSGSPATTQDPGWPREVTKNGATLTYYQPQIDAWTDYRQVDGRVAFSLTPSGGKAALGVASLSAKTQTDKDAGTVVIKTIQITSTRFPGLEVATAKSNDASFRQLFPTTGMTVSLDRVLAGVDKGKTAAKPVGVKTDPPPIFVSERDAILLFVDGDPVQVPVDGTTLKMVVNTNWPLFFDDTGKGYYLLLGKSWVKASALNGPWTAATALPSDFSKLPAGDEFSDVRAAVPAKLGGTPPNVFFAAKPGELIEFDGKPVWTDVAPTRLLAAKNTDSDVFLHKDQNLYYVLLSGRWFNSASLDGPWSYAGADLPSDFAKIPTTDSHAAILASVPGTQQASDAVLLAEIPTTAVVNRAEAEKNVKVTYDGDPKFAPIDKTDMQYALNTQDKVILSGKSYYLCYQGVWFVASDPNGPWKTADMIPAEIYSIPTSSPVHNVTYVYVTDPTPTTVVTSYSAGYTGVFVMSSGGGMTVVYGTGFYYPPYMYYPPYAHYPVYRPYPYTYCASAHYNPYTGGYAVGRSAYGPYGGYGQAAAYNPKTGTYARAATVQTPYGGRTAAQSYNPYTGVRSSTVQGSSPYGQWGSTAVQQGNDWAVSNHVTTDQGTVRRTTTSSGASGTTVRGPGGQTTRVATDANNNVYAGKDGNVYKKDASGDWSKYENGGWQNAQGSGATKPATTATAGTGKPTTSATKPATGSASGAAAQRPTSQPSAGTSSRDAGGVPSDVQRDASSRQAGSDRAAQSSASRSSGGASSRSGGGGRRR